ncbi:MAG: glycosyltransferase family 2 protein [Rhizobiaceae bacterium]|nr:glycosyltransferase family 2 protein [Rhizobiaceae bacterium]
MAQTRGSAGKLLSIIVPVLDEEETIALFLGECVPMLEALRHGVFAGGDYEVVFVDDGSTDATPLAIHTASLSNPRLKLVRLSRNFGKEAALAAGFLHASGDAVIPMDVDLQDPPEVVPRMIEEWRRGADIVNAVRRSRGGDSAFKRWTARGFYRLYNRIADVPIRPDVGDFRLLDRAVVDTLNRLSEGSRFTKALYSWVGFRNVDIDYDRTGRSAGTTKWRYGKLFRFAIDGFIASTTVPLRIWSGLGLLLGAVAVIWGIFIIVKTIIYGADQPGYASTMVAILFLGALNLLSLGILGEYVGRIAQEVRNRPLFVVRETLGIDPRHARRRGPDDARE